jgi:hypothetical protein
MNEQRVSGQLDGSAKKEDPEVFELVFDEVADEDSSLGELGLDAQGLSILGVKDEVTGIPCDLIVPSVPAA